jgi:hypothetical protein
MEVPDPMRVLQSIFGALPRKQTAGSVDGRPEELTEEVEFGGLSLQEFAAAKEDRGSAQPSDVHSYTVQSIEQCMCLRNPISSRNAHDVIQMAMRRRNSKTCTSQLL